MRPSPAATQGPPPNVEAAALWERLSKKERPRVVVDFPRQDPETGEPEARVAIVILRQSEVMSCLAAAEEYARSMLKSPSTGSLGYEGLWREAQVCELLVRACKNVEHQHAPFFLDAKQLRRDLSNDEITVLFNAYLHFQAESGPIIGTMTDEEMDAWLDKLKEGGSRLPLAQLSSEARTDLLMRSVSRLATSSMDSTSAGSQPSESSEKPAPPDLVDGEAPTPQEAT